MLALNFRAYKPSLGRDYFFGGGVVLRLAILPALGEQMDALRRKHGIPVHTEHGWDAPATFDLEDEAQVEWQTDVIALAEGLEVRFIGYGIRYQIARAKGERDTRYFGIHGVTSHFHLFLESEVAYGMVIADRRALVREPELLGEVFLEAGRTVGSFDPRRKFSRIPLFAMGDTAWSHALAVTDVLVGAFGDCLNRTGPEARRAAHFRALHRLMVRLNGRVMGGGLILRPDKIHSDRYRREREELLALFSSHIGSSLR